MRKCNTINIRLRLRASNHRLNILSIINVKFYTIEDNDKNNKISIF